MKTVKGTYFQNDSIRPLVYGEVEIDNPPRRRLRGEPLKEGILGPKFPQGKNRLINGHEGIVWVPSQKRFAIVLIRGGDSFDPTRYTEDESYFEYGCDQADGLFCDEGYFHPDMLLEIPEGFVRDGRLPLSFAKKMVFPDPYACMVFQLERTTDLGSAHNFRVEMAWRGCGEEEARRMASENLYRRTVIFGLGTTGMFMGDLIRRSFPEAKILFVARSASDSPKVRFALEQCGGEYLQNTFASEAETAEAICRALEGRATLFIGVSGSEAEHRIAFEHRALGCNGVYNSFSLGPKISFDTMPFGFENHLIFGSINFRKEHMETAIRLLAGSRYDEIVELIDKDEFTADPIAAYENRIYAKGAPLKTAVVWNPEYIDFSR